MHTRGSSLRPLLLSALRFANVTSLVFGWPIPHVQQVPRRAVGDRARELPRLLDDLRYSLHRYALQRKSSQDVKFRSLPCPKNIKDKCRLCIPKPSAARKQEVGAEEGGSGTFSVAWVLSRGGQWLRGGKIRACSCNYVVERSLYMLNRQVERRLHLFSATGSFPPPSVFCASGRRGVPKLAGDSVLPALLRNPQVGGRSRGVLSHPVRRLRQRDRGAHRRRRADGRARRGRRAGRSGESSDRRRDAELPVPGRPGAPNTRR